MSPTQLAGARLRRGVAVPAALFIVVGGAVTASGLLAPRSVSATTACPTLAASPTVYTAVGIEACFTVPANVTSVHAVLIGGTGGTGAAATGGTPGVGGHGAQVTADIPVTAGEAVYVEVGGDGQPGAGAVCGLAHVNLLQTQGGYNGGADGGDVANSNVCTSYTGGGGGGSTDLRTVAMVPSDGNRCVNAGSFYAGGAESLASRILVAGGGGGGGNPAAVLDSAGGDGGTAGDPTPANQNGGTPLGGGTGGTAATTSAAGTGGPAAVSVGANSGPGSDGSGICGGVGGLGDSHDGQDSGGGGGGGYFGGGGGGGGPCTGEGCIAPPTAGIAHTTTASADANLPSIGGGGGGGAGSSFAEPSATNVTIAPDAPNPSATITYTVPATPTPSPSGVLPSTITVPDTGGWSSGLEAGAGILGAGAILVGIAVAGRRRRQLP